MATDSFRVRSLDLQPLLTEIDVTTNKRKAIRTLLARIGLHATPEQVVDALRDIGIGASTRLVAQVKAQMLRDEAKAIKERSKRPPKTKSRRRPQQQKNPPRRR